MIHIGRFEIILNGYSADGNWKIMSINAIATAVNCARNLCIKQSRDENSLKFFFHKIGVNSFFSHTYPNGITNFHNIAGRKISWWNGWNSYINMSRCLRFFLTTIYHLFTNGFVDSFGSSFTIVVRLICTAMKSDLL